MLHKIQAALFLAALALLPAAEWRSIVLPVNQKPLGFDPAGQASASPFDLVFLLFCVCLVPAVVRFVRERVWLSPGLAHWWAAAVLLVLMLATNQHMWPFLTPLVRKVIDARSLLIHVGVMVAVAIYVSRLRPETVVRGAFAFCVASAALFAVLSALAIAEVPLFSFRYPFTNPTHIAFPFPTYNMASGFMAVACLGLVGAAVSLRIPIAIVAGLPIFLLAAALTGSRSGLFVLILTLVMFGLVTGLPLLRRAAGVVVRRRIGLTAVVAASLAAGVLVIRYDWQPIRRALSIFQDVAQNPLILLTGQPGSPRHELWRLARNRVHLDEFDANRNYRLILTVVDEGCVRESQPVKGLEPGRDYWVRLRQTTVNGNSRSTVAVFSDSSMMQLVGLAALDHKPLRLANFSMYLSDTGARYVMQGGNIGEFNLLVDGQALRPSADEVISYFDPLNGAPGTPVAFDGESIEIAAKDRKIRGFVNWARRVPQPKRELVFEYHLTLNRVMFTLPLDSPAMFFVGLHDTDARAGNDWTDVRNGLFVQHRREMTAYEQDVLVRRDAEDAWGRMEGPDNPARRARFERQIKERSCSPSGAYKVGDIWKASYTSVDVNFDDIYNANAEGKGPDGLSVLADPTWSAERHLRDGGSTHNVYLDWYYYEGVPALVAFLVFAFGLLASAAAAAWRLRAQPYGAFASVVCLQVVVILLFMYAQPYIWVKYFWVVFGVASALAINGDARPRAS